MVEQICTDSTFTANVCRLKLPGMTDDRHIGSWRHSTTPRRPVWSETCLVDRLCEEDRWFVPSHDCEVWTASTMLASICCDAAPSNCTHSSWWLRRPDLSTKLVTQTTDGQTVAYTSQWPHCDLSAIADCRYEEQAISSLDHQYISNGRHCAGYSHFAGFPTPPPICHATMST